MEDLANFARLIEAIRPWLPHLVIVGGWAHRLHRFHPLATNQDYEPLLTRDVDVAFSLDAPLEGDIQEALERADFKAELSSEFTPPVTHYRLGDQDAGFYAEFLTAKVGSELNRGGQRDLTVSRAGITAQKLRHLDLLLDTTWLVAVGLEVMPVTRAADLLVPNPVSFMVQKLLIHKQRASDKKAQDVLYIHDTLELFGGSLDKLRTVWEDDVRPRIASSNPKTFAPLLIMVCGKYSDDLIRGWQVGFPLIPAGAPIKFKALSHYDCAHAAR